MKKLLVAGLPKIYQICPVYRNAEGSSIHSCEFTMLEWYRTETDYEGIMQDTVGLLRHIATRLDISAYRHGGYKADPFLEWEKISVCDAFKKYADIHLEEFLPDHVGAFRDEVARIGLTVSEEDGWDDLFFKVSMNKIEPHLGMGQPTILYDYPAHMAALSKIKASQQINLAEPKLIGKNDNDKEIYLKNGRFGPYLQYELLEDEIVKTKKRKTKKEENNLKNVSIPKGLDIENIDLEKAKYLCSLPKILGTHPDIGKEITVNVGRFGPYLKCENKSARIESVDELFSIGLNRAITLISEAKPGRMSSSMIKDLGEHPEDKKPVRVMKGQYGPYIKYKSLNATIPEEKDPTELTMEEALILIEKRKEYDKTKKSKKRKSK